MQQKMALILFNKNNAQNSDSTVWNFFGYLINLGTFSLVTADWADPMCIVLLFKANSVPFQLENLSQKITSIFNQYYQVMGHCGTLIILMGLNRGFGQQNILAY